MFSSGGCRFFSVWVFFFVGRGGGGRGCLWVFFFLRVFLQAKGGDFDWESVILGERREREDVPCQARKPFDVDGTT